MKNNNSNISEKLGVHLLENGRCSFKIWAPDVQNISLCIIEDSNIVKEYSMENNGNSVFSVITDNVKTGDFYKFKLDNGLLVPDAYSKFQPFGVHGASQIIDSHFNWENNINWKGRSWQETVIYELHVGTFTEEGSYLALIDKLDYLCELGVTAIELMPIADFTGERGWGYDGVSIYAPNSRYGTVNDLKKLIKTAHQKGLMVFNDVVYNHFGPDGNYLYCYAQSEFFDKSAKTLWGDAINFKNPMVRDFYINNVLYWLEEFHFDGIRFDAIHAIEDDSEEHILDEIARITKEKFEGKREIHLVLENGANQSSYLKNGYDAQWNDDSHHCFHTYLTGEFSGYYVDFSEQSTGKSYAQNIAKILSEGFLYQGQASIYANNVVRGEYSKDLSPSKFVNFIQNHDQIGNRAFGDRISNSCKIEKLKNIIAINLLSPSIPLLFMGEEWAASSPFLFFCDVPDELKESVRNGRREEFSKFPEFSSPKTRELIPDPLDIETFEKSKLKWDEIKEHNHFEMLTHYRELLELRKNFIIPLIIDINQEKTEITEFSKSAFAVSWHTKDKKLTILANLGDNEVEIPNNSYSDLIYPVSDKKIILNGKLRTITGNTILVFVDTL
ncbi:MAG: malto-oligosyltrehalose trehalohydrolase [Candidatus Gastranaerophilales bacterium]|nr:malto-oligosyltrehalose trehalohydrolase [Candidatus Gastranaerophilales bacterium]